MSIPEVNHQLQAGVEVDDEVRCLLYLLGEMDAEGARQFEATLAGNPKLGEVLDRQASLMTTISCVPSPETTSASAPVVLPVKALPPSSTVRPWRWVAAMAAIAACVALLLQLQGLSPNGDQMASVQQGNPSEATSSNDSEASLIAKAWALSQREVDDAPDDYLDPSVDELVDLGMDEPLTDLDSTLSWMFAAVASSEELRESEGNDG